MTRNHTPPQKVESYPATTHIKRRQHTINRYQKGGTTHLPRDDKIHKARVRQQAIRDDRNEAARVPPIPPATTRFIRLGPDNKQFATMSLESPPPGKRSRTSDISTLNNPRRMSSALSIQSDSPPSSHKTRPHRSGDPPSFPSSRSSCPNFDDIENENKFCEAEFFLLVGCNVHWFDGRRGNASSD